MNRFRLDDGGVRPSMTLTPTAALGVIRRMTAVVRDAASDPAGEPGRLGWWVLAQGQSLAGEPFERRDQLRERLREAVAEAGVVLDEFVWVHDERECAQLVVATLPSRERAVRVAQGLAGRGLNVLVMREAR